MTTTNDTIPCTMCGGTKKVDMGYCDKHKKYERVASRTFDGPVLECAEPASDKYTIASETCPTCDGSGKVSTDAA